MTIAPDLTELTAAVDACAPAGPPIEVGARRATPAELKAAQGARELAGAAGWGWTVFPTYAQGWRGRKRPAFTIDPDTGEVFSVRDGKGTAPQLVCPSAVRWVDPPSRLRAIALAGPQRETHQCKDTCETVAPHWGRVETIAVRLAHHDTGLRAVGVWARWLGPHYVTDTAKRAGRVGKPATWSGIAPELWWWHLDPATQCRPTAQQVAYRYVTPVGVTELKTALAASADPELSDEALVALFQALPPKTPEKDED